MGKFSDGSFRENQNTHFMVKFVFENRAEYEIMWKNTVEPDRPQMTYSVAQKICNLHADRYDKDTEVHS
jgi:hypothetical protein